MRTIVRRRVVAWILLTAGLGFLVAPKMTAADGGSSIYKPVLPDAEFARLVGDDAKIIVESLEKASDKKMAAKARMSALMIAVYAQSSFGKGGAKKAELGALRDTALKVAKAVADGKFDEAKILAADLKPAGTADTSAKPYVAVHEPFDTDTLMQQFKPERGGGLDLEKNLQKLTVKRAAYVPNDYQQLIPMLFRVAMIAQACEAMAPARDEGKKTRAEWIKLAQEMGILSVEAGEAAKAAKPDEKKVKSILKKLEDNCSKCHVVFRDN